MAWTDITRPDYEREGVLYASDCTDAEWALIEPFMPQRKNTGRPRTTQLRDVWNAIQYMATTGCQWRMLPRDFPPMSTVQSYFLRVVPLFRIVTAPLTCSTPFAEPIPGYAMSLRTVPTLDPNCTGRWTRSDAGQLRSSSDRIPPNGSRCSPDAGWSNGPSHGSADAGGSPRTGRNPSSQPKAGSSLLTSNS